MVKLNSWSQRLGLCIISMLLVYACGAPKKVSMKEDTPVAKNNLSDILHGFDTLNIQSDYVRMQAKFSSSALPIPGSVKLEIKMKAGEYIWAKAKAFAFEAGQVYITPEKVVAVNRLQKEVIMAPMSKAEEILNFPLEMGMIEDILMGRVSFDQFDYKLKGSSEDFVLAAEKGDIRHEANINLSPLALEQLNYEKEADDVKLACDYLDYKSITKHQKFSYLREYIINRSNTKSIEAKLNITKIEIDKPFETNFKIPDNYSVRQL